MARSLDVYLYKDLVGHLIQDNSGQIGFKYVQNWLDNPEAVALSQSLPLRENSFSRKECRAFFGGILPEEAQRTAVAKNLGVSERNDFALLERIGGECAGAVTFIPNGESLPEQVKGYRALSASELVKILKELPQRPLLAGEGGIRLSLAGAQNKLAVRVSEAGISIPLGDSPSTHILKPANTLFDGLIENEAFCLDLAKAVGLNVTRATLNRTGAVDYLLIERYDRLVGTSHQEQSIEAIAKGAPGTLGGHRPIPPSSARACPAEGKWSEAESGEVGELAKGPELAEVANREGGRGRSVTARRARMGFATASITRLHQEDFCQALGIASEMKYQNEGGPSFKLSFELLRNASTIPALDLIALFNAAVFNYLVGNHDAHGKNFSLLYTPSGRGVVQTRFAPLYDLVCTAAYPNLAKKMAMKLGGEYDSSKVLPQHFERLAEEAGLTKRLARERVQGLTELTLKNLPDLAARYPKTETVVQIVKDNTEKMIRCLSAS